jgi:hypothetical protein
MYRNEGGSRGHVNESLIVKTFKPHTHKLNAQGLSKLHLRDWAEDSAGWALVRHGSKAFVSQFSALLLAKLKPVSAANWGLLQQRTPFCPLIGHSCILREPETIQPNSFPPS